MNLYEVTLQKAQYQTYYVVCEDETKAIDLIREHFNNANWYFIREGFIIKHLAKQGEFDFLILE